MRVFLLGAGAIAREHAKAAAGLTDGAADLHVADARPEAAAQLAAEFPKAVSYAGVGQMLALPARPDDVVVVATPVFAHCENVMSALQSGRHVLCEKPMAFDTNQAFEMLRAARSAKRMLGCCSSRFLGTALSARLRDRIAGGGLGDVYHVTWRTRQRRARTGVEYQSQTTWFLDRAKSGGGVLIDWGPYDISLLAEILSPSRVEVRSAWLATPEAFAPNHPKTIDVEFHAGAAMVWHTERGQVHITFERASCTHGPEGSLFAFEGTLGAAQYNWLNWGEANSLTFSTEAPDGAPTSEVFEEPMGNVHERPLRAFADAVRGRAKPGSALVADTQAVFNFAILRAIYSVAERGSPQTVSFDEIERGPLG